MIPSNDRSFADGIIWVGDTSEEDAPRRIEEQLEAIGPVVPNFRILSFRKFSTMPLDSDGNPLWCPLIFHDWSNPADQRSRQGGRLNSIVFDMSVLRQSAPCNSQTTADLFMRYTASHGRIVPDWDEPHQYISALDARPLIDRDILRVPGMEREPKVLALVETRTGLAIPLPKDSAIVWQFFQSGFGFEMSVWDGIALRRQQKMYPLYFAKEDRTNEAEVEMDIADCLKTLEALQDGRLNPRDLADPETGGAGTSDPDDASGSDNPSDPNDSGNHTGCTK